MFANSVFKGESFSSALRRDVSESGRECRHWYRGGFEEALMLALKVDCANRRLGAFLMPSAGRGDMKSWVPRSSFEI
jgi:hypothetical protein